MASLARSFEIRAGDPGAVVRALRQAAATVSKPKGAVLFTSGRLSQQLLPIARRLSQSPLGFGVVIAGGTGVLSERGELEAQDAATGMVWSGGAMDLCALSTSATDHVLGEELADWLLAHGAKTASAALLFAKPQGFTPETFAPLRQAQGLCPVAGAGTVGPHGAVGVTVAGEILEGNVLAVLLRGCAPPVVKTAHPCRCLTPMQPITRAEGSLVLAIDGRPALEVLSEAGRSAEGQPLIITVLAPEDATVDGAQSLIRGIQGIDPTQRALMISGEVREGMKIAFAVRDPSAAREQLGLRLREAARDTAGGAPKFALYFNCSGRGSDMYGSPGVDARMIGERFGNLPLSGLNSAFEIAPFDGGPALQLYTGVLVLFSQLS